MSNLCLSFRKMPRQLGYVVSSPVVKGDKLAEHNPEPDILNNSVVLSGSLVGLVLL